MYNSNQNQEVVRLILRLRTLEEDYPNRMLTARRDFLCDTRLTICGRVHTLPTANGYQLRPKKNPLIRGDFFQATLAPGSVA